MDRYDKADIVAVIGMALAAVDMGSMAPSNMDMIGEGGLGLAGLAILTNLYHKHKDNLISKFRSVVKKETGLDISEDAVEDAVEKAIDVAEDLADDGKLNNSND